MSFLSDKLYSSSYIVGHKLNNVQSHNHNETSHSIKQSNNKRNYIKEQILSIQIPTEKEFVENFIAENSSEILAKEIAR